MIHGRPIYFANFEFHLVTVLQNILNNYVDNWQLAIGDGRPETEDGKRENGERWRETEEKKAEDYEINLVLRRNYFCLFTFYFLLFTFAFLIDETSMMFLATNEMN